MSLRDYFQEENKHKSPDGHPNQTALVVEKADEWALQYIKYVRLVIESQISHLSLVLSVSNQFQRHLTMTPLGL
jgi:hypothetical protein